MTLFDLDLTSLLKRTNPVCREALEEAYQNCIQRKHATLTLGHFFFRILERQNTDIHVLLKHYAIKPADISRQFRSALDHAPAEAQASSPAIHHLIPKLFTDAWILSELNRLIEECVAGYEEGNGFVPATKIREFVWNVFAAHYIEMVKGRAYGDGVSKEEIDAARFTLHRVMKGVLLLTAPITPHMTDHIWRKLYGQRSIHLERFPEADKRKVSKGTGPSIIKFNEKIWKAKRDKGVSLREPIEATIPSKLRPHVADLGRMHHIQKPHRAATSTKN
ncbi:MAG: class I tRNA ligase family protein [Thaumarchaeota archaeon]|nr:class I tRNA ligase family protein [Nitrososphaerota archaeon]